MPESQRKTCFKSLTARARACTKKEEAKKLGLQKLRNVLPEHQSHQHSKLRSLFAAQKRLQNLTSQIASAVAHGNMHSGSWEQSCTALLIAQSPTQDIHSMLGKLPIHQE